MAKLISWPTKWVITWSLKINNLMDRLEGKKNTVDRETEFFS